MTTYRYCYFKMASELLKKEPVYWSPISVINRDDSQGGIIDKYVVENFSGVRLLDGFTSFRTL